MTKAPSLSGGPPCEAGILVWPASALALRAAPASPAKESMSGPEAETAVQEGQQDILTWSSSWSRSGAWCAVRSTKALLTQDWRPESWKVLCLLGKRNANVVRAGVPPESLSPRERAPACAMKRTMSLLVFPLRGGL